MTKNSNAEGYAQVFKGPDGEPMVLLRGADFATLVKTAAGASTKVAAKTRKRTAASSAQIERWVDIADELRARMSGDFTSDETAYAEAKEAVERGESQLVPGDVAERLIAGESPLKVWREHRGLKQKELESATGVGQDVISKIENRKSSGDVATLKALADGLGVLVDDLVI